MANKQHKHEHGTCMPFFPRYEGSIYHNKFSKKGDLYCLRSTILLSVNAYHGFISSVLVR